MTPERLAEIKAYVEDYCWDNAEQDELAIELVTALETAQADNLRYDHQLDLASRIIAGLVPKDGGHWTPEERLIHKWRNVMFGDAIPYP